MPHRKKTLIARIPVVDQVGKRHVVVKYQGPPEPMADDGASPSIEYRLANGHSVRKTGDDSFQSVDGRLRLKTV